MTYDELKALSPEHPVWAHTITWLGKLSHSGVLVKVNLKRSKVRFVEFRGQKNHDALVPNRSIDIRHPNDLESVR